MPAVAETKKRYYYRTQNRALVRPVIDAYIEGKRIVQISEKFKLGRNTIHQWLVDNEVPLRPRNHTSLQCSVKECLDPAIRGYVAGLVDGEGSILLRRNKSGIQRAVQIANTDRSMLDFVVKSFGGQVTLLRANNGRFGKRPIYVWNFRKTINILRFLEQISPYLITKKQKAEELIEFCGRRLGLWPNQEDT